MTTPFDAAQDLADAPRVTQGQRPRDAATLILLDGDRVLMGRRAPGHVFMPSKWVFPGGRLDRADFAAAATGQPDSRTAALLGAQMPVRRGRALMLTAVRETFEETGLVLGTPAPPASVAGPWRTYRQAGALPDLSALTYVARAITPPGRARRFDARFFTARASSLLRPEASEGCGELDEIAWVSLDEAERLDLPAITRFVLGEVRARRADPDLAPPFVRMVRGRHLVTRA